MRSASKAEELKALLEKKYLEFNQLEFIGQDPISIPHRFKLKQDIEIAAFWTAMLSWGQRVTIINKSRELISLMDEAPYDFVLHSSESDQKRFLKFVHRTFQPTDALYFLDFFRRHYGEHESLENAFCLDEKNMQSRLAAFHHYFFDVDYAPQRSRKHVATPERGSTCKRLNMFLRWMVRKDKSGVDFGIWDKISPAELMCPLDVHVDRVARKLGLMQRKQTDWRTVEELTSSLRAFDPEDPVKYDFALFGLGVIEKWT